MVYVLNATKGHFWRAPSKKDAMAAILPSNQTLLTSTFFSLFSKIVWHMTYVINGISSLLPFLLPFSCYVAKTVWPRLLYSPKLSNLGLCTIMYCFGSWFTRRAPRFGAPAGPKSLPNKKEMESFFPPLTLLHFLVLDLNSDPDLMNQDSETSPTFCLIYMCC